MALIDAQQIAVIGLGGGGSEVIQELQRQFPDSAQYLALDVNSDVFGVFYSGYVCDVVPPIQSWVRAEGGEVRNWFYAYQPIVPLRDIPDIFLRNTTRPLMKASLLMQRLNIESYLRETLDSPKEIVLTTQSIGATGSTWILEVAKILEELFPASAIRLILSRGMDERYSNLVAMHKALANTYWTLREINSHRSVASTSVVVPSLTAAVTCIASVITGGADEFTSENESLISDVLLEVAQDLRLTIDDRFALQSFLSSRAASLSELLDQDDWCALVGLVLAFAEERVDAESTDHRSCWRGVSFRSRMSGSRETFVIPDIESFARLPIGLAHSHKGFGPREHQRALVTLSNEGSTALAAPEALITDDAVGPLVEISHSLKRRIKDVDELGVGDFSQRFVADVYPELHRLISQILIAKGASE